MKLWYLIEGNMKKCELIVNRQDLFKYTLDEILVKKYEDINYRDEYLYHCDENGISYLYYNETDIDVRKSLLTNIDYSKIDTLVGDIGFSNERSGEVLKIDWNDNISEKIKKVCKNTILVVPQTTPAFIGLLSKCIGLVTDEGGITGHSSIISREMGISSIIGTKIATKVFKDGDIVEIIPSEKMVRKVVSSKS